MKLGNDEKKSNPKNQCVSVQFKWKTISYILFSQKKGWPSYDVDQVVSEEVSHDVLSNSLTGESISFVALEVKPAHLI
jgi:hypothetical protein